MSTQVRLLKESASRNDPENIPVALRVRATAQICGTVNPGEILRWSTLACDLPSPTLLDHIIEDLNYLVEVQCFIDLNCAIDAVILHGDGEGHVAFSFEKHSMRSLASMSVPAFAAKYECSR
jgi:hypothetical protein